MEVKFSEKHPDIKFDDQGKPSIIAHCHDSGLFFFSKPSKKTRQNRADEHVSQIKGCIAFYQTLATETKDPIAKAHIARIVVEDEELIKKCEEERPKDCSVM